MTAFQHFRNMIVMAAADGTMSESELRLLAHRAAEMGITDDEFEEAINYAMSDQADIAVPDDREERHAILKDMIRVMAADGTLNDHEKRLFAVVATVYEVDGDELNQLIDEVLADT